MAFKKAANCAVCMSWVFETPSAQSNLWTMCRTDEKTNAVSPLRSRFQQRPFASPTTVANPATLPIILYRSHQISFILWWVVPFYGAPYCIKGRSKVPSYKAIILRHGPSSPNRRGRVRATGQEGLHREEGGR